MGRHESSIGETRARGAQESMMSHGGDFPISMGNLVPVDSSPASVMFQGLDMFLWIFHTGMGKLTHCAASVNHRWGWLYRIAPGGVFGDGGQGGLRH
jgi:hypothetical protein